MFAIPHVAAVGGLGSTAVTYGPGGGGWMALPLLLAGPILRPVESNLMSVWLAFSERCDMVLRTWEGRARSGQQKLCPGASPKTISTSDRYWLEFGVTWL
jgi:hypothetical protein